jgi:predicted ribosome quality control (RQC) complex YloA/Tae2 family protein
LPDASRLRREAEALLANPHLKPNADGSFDVPDPSEPGLVHHVVTAGGVSPPSHANQLFSRARRLEGARRQVEARLAETRAALAEARRVEDRLRGARDIAELPAGESREAQDAEAEDEAATRRYLTSRGLELLVGRNAKENQRLSFEVARPDDVWCHALDVPGSHVVLRDGERRANLDDEREAAEVAAFCSGARGNTKVDVHVTRRKFVLPIRGTPGRVRIVHSEIRRVTPRDPEGRLRRR